MDKKSLIFSGVILSLLSIGLVSAQGLSELLSTIDPSTVILSISFMISFVVIYFATSKMFKGNKAVPTIISICISLLIIYGINSSTSLQTGVQNIFSGFGFSSDTLYTIGSVLLLIFIIFLIIKLKSTAFLILGIVCLLLSFSGLIYSTELVAGIGLGFIAVWIIILMFKKKVKVGGSSPSYNPSSHSTTNYYNTIKEEKEEKSKIGKEKAEINKERDMGARARGMATATEDYARQEASMNTQKQRQMATEGQKLRQEEQVEKSESLQITSDIGSLIQTYNQLQISYNDVQKQNPSDPRLREIFDQMVGVRNEIKRLKSLK